jgi:hypothetical protein
MSPGRLFVRLAMLAGLAMLLAGDASGVPVFARKYGFNCTMCHSTYPRLNDFGSRFRANGYRVPGRDAVEKSVLDSPPPIALRTSVGYTFDEFRHVNAPERRSNVELNGLDLISAGLLGPRIGFFLIYTPGITEARGVAGQEASLEMASVVFSNIARTNVSLRAGRFEPAYAAFSVKRHLGVSPYEIYDYSFPGGPAFSETQTGVEIRGGGYGPLRVAAGLVEGSATNAADDAPQDGYLRLEGLLGPGEGQTVGQKFGLTGYLGRARPLAEVEAGTREMQKFTRLGADASLNAMGCNLALQYLWARDDGPLWGAANRITWSGGFAELSFTPGVHDVGFARFDLVKEPSFLGRDFRRFTAGWRYYLEDNTALHLEFSHLVLADSGAADDPVEDFLTARVDVAF